jgi:glucose/mannose transport system substrate-binding protein
VHDRRDSLMRSPSYSTLPIAVALLAGVAGPGCSVGARPTSTVEIMHWWSRGGEAEAIRALLAEVRRQYPEVAIVDGSVQGGSVEARAAIANRMSRGIPPDTFLANGGWGLMTWVLYNGVDAKQSKMDQIDDVAADWRDRVPDKVLGSVSYDAPDGKHVYGVPLNIHRINTLFYNKALFEEIDIHPEEDLTDLPGLFTVAEKIKQFSQLTGRKIAPIALGYGEKQTWTLALVFFENLLVGRENLAAGLEKGDLYQQLFMDPKKQDAFSAEVAYAVDDFRKLISYANEDAKELVWDKAMDRVLKREAAMTIMGDWAKGYANAAGYGSDDFGFIPMPGTAGTFVFTTDTFGLPIGADESTRKLLKVFGSAEGQKIFNQLKGSISARLDVEIAYDDDRRPTYDDFVAAGAANKVIPATSIVAQQAYVDAISAALAAYADKYPNGVVSDVLHTLDNYSDLLFSSCWPACQN